MACAGTVTEHARKVLEETFGAQVHNKYGSRDCGDMACECDHGNLHIYTPNVVLEIVDEDGHPVEPGATGRILVTILGNRSFPLIRYEIGDIGSLSSDRCSCGRSFPLMKQIEGRTMEMLQTTDGRYISPVYFRHLIGVVHNPGFIRRFQIVQQTTTRIELRIELENGAPEDRVSHTLDNILRDLRAVFGNETEIRVFRMNEIPLSGSGKFLYCVRMSQTENANSLRP